MTAMKTFGYKLPDVLFIVFKFEIYIQSYARLNSTRYILPI